MLLQRITDFVLRSRYTAMLAAFVCDAPVIWSGSANSLIYSLLVLIISTTSIAIVGLVTLRKGALEGFYTLVAATVPYLLAYWFYPEDYSQQLILVSMLLAQLSNILTWICAVVLYRTFSWNVTLEVLGFICIVMVLFVHAVFPDLYSWWDVQLHEIVKQAMQNTDIDLDTAITQMQLYATRFAVMFVWINTVVQLWISRWWEIKIFNLRVLSKELHHIRLSQTAGVLFVIGLVLSFFQTDVVADVMIVFYLTFGFAGFSVVHDIAASLKAKGGWLLFAVYIMLPITIFIIPMVGLLDVWMDFRKKLR